MQAQYFKLPKQFHQSISVRRDRLPYFYNDWHYHPELELVLILKGEGTRFVGDNIARFESGDLVLINSNLPHVWKSDDEYFLPESRKMVIAIVIHFSIDFMGTHLWSIPEFSAITRLLELSRRGISFHIPEGHLLRKLLNNIPKLSPLDRLLMLLKILNQLTELPDNQILSSIAFVENSQEHQSARMDKINNFILLNFSKEIPIEKIALIANMTVASLCRYFKKKTRKSVTEFINEVRIGYACKLLIDGKFTITDICYQCGYNNSSYFNRQFKKITQINPSQYLAKKDHFERRTLRHCQ